MNRGELLIEWNGSRISAAITAVGWVSPSPELATLLNRVAPLPSSEVGDPVVRAFQAARKAFGRLASVVTEPTAAPYPPAARG